mmetsp:Transcript_1605/g.3548  ORF Transcript_1605/g.3548 Transcript_1605/m.3548 type:complete len:354 (-) Transcript_1605:1000-2061(-)|eukprot:CAMPEP_0198237256 /NCGR_PEP_ID=MMETSP1446-20131203/3102_1 /TAXON_ID=1461542 ORGANISM="Unidentified sp, Strain CCMP2111" /NCGR_SAMPLE_ID=MMETSP1446 /ASSEMBLY_ACC=CAM_ASM_001112 /LENGTH=353 /DNA_ID=CAMNT_0043919347 /DNA_START=148 /DNA_END=1209 /DNA_ORIENTATION=+
MAPTLLDRVASRTRSAPRERRPVKLPQNELLLRESRRVIVEDIASSGRISVHCIAEKFDKSKLLNELNACKRGGVFCDGVAIAPGLGGDNGQVEMAELGWEWEDVLHCPCMSTWTGEHLGDVFFFEWGVATFWGFEDAQEAGVLRRIACGGCSISPLDLHDVESEEFRFQYTEEESPGIANDTIVMAQHLSTKTVKLATCYALAQSTKLKVNESSISQQVDKFIELPRTLAKTGKVEMPKKEIHKLTGAIFLEKCAVNLLGPVMDTPAFFWDASDALCALYDAIFEYLEIDDRIEILNARFEICEAMLDMLRDHQHAENSSFLEWIVIVLLIVEVAIGIVEILGLTGLLPHYH